MIIPKDNQSGSLMWCLTVVQCYPEREESICLTTNLNSYGKLTKSYASRYCGQLCETLGRIHSSAGVQYFGVLGLKRKSYTDVFILMWSFLLVTYCSSLCPKSSGHFPRTLLTVSMCFVSLVCLLMKATIQLVKLVFHVISKTTWFVFQQCFVVFPQQFWRLWREM